MGVSLNCSSDGKCRDIFENVVLFLNTRRWMKPEIKYTWYVIGVMEEGLTNMSTM
jgi:hypothetical protein